jgi:hypothetical protein
MVPVVKMCTHSVRVYTYLMGVRWIARRDMADRHFVILSTVAAVDILATDSLGKCHAQVVWSEDSDGVGSSCIRAYGNGGSSLIADSRVC